MLTQRENFIRNARFQYPQWTPITIAVNDATKRHLGRELYDVMKHYPLFFPNIDKNAFGNPKSLEEALEQKDNFVTDKWGCVWNFPIPGFDGIVVNSPLKDWDNFKNYKFPNDLKDINWENVKSYGKQLKDNGQLFSAGIPEHGWLFLRITYLRGFENAMFDFMDDEPRLQILIDGIVEYYESYVQNYVNCGVDMMSFADDLGTQTATILSPEKLKQYIFPACNKLMTNCKNKGVLIHMHSDGHTIDILEEQIKAGVDIVNPQDLCNGIDELARRIKGKACIDLDIDRQKILPFGTPKEIEEHIEYSVKMLGDKRGGLQFIVGIYPPTPPENIDALCRAFQKYRTYWFDK
jgi:predicted peroxiredoxin